MIIKVANNLDQNAPLSYLSFLESTAGTQLRVKNINAYTASWAVQIGKTGDETSEIMMLGTATPSGTALTFAGTTVLRFDHPADTPVYSINYDQVIFKRSTTGTAGTAVAIGTTPITPDSEYTQYDDTSGTTGYAYKAQYFNSVGSAVSEESDWLTTSGYNFYSLNKMRSRVKDKLFNAGYIKYESQIDDWINEWLENMNGILVDVNQDYNIGTADVAFAATTGLGTITSEDFKEIRRMWITTDGTNYFQAVGKKLVDFLPDQTYSELYPIYYMQGDSVFGIKPCDTAGTARIHYYKLSSPLTNDADELPVPMRGYSKSFVNYALSQAYFMDNKDPKGKIFGEMADNDANKFRAEITPRGKSGPNFITMTDATSGDYDAQYII